MAKRCGSCAASLITSPIAASTNDAGLSLSDAATKAVLDVFGTTWAAPPNGWVSCGNARTAGVWGALAIGSTRGGALREKNWFRAMHYHGAQKKVSILYRAYLRKYFRSTCRTRWLRKSWRIIAQCHVERISQRALHSDVYAVVHSHYSSAMLGWHQDAVPKRGVQSPAACADQEGSSESADCSSATSRASV